MKRKAVPLFRIGLFVVAAFIVLIVFIFYIGNKEKLFSSTTELIAHFQTVSNLQRGAEIDMAGINVGSVKDIQLPRNSRDSVVVTMKIITDALKLIHTDSKAVISTQGLIGDKVIYITMGGDSAPAVLPGSVLQGQAPQDFTKIYDTLSMTVTQLDSVAILATDLIGHITNGNGTLGKLVNDSSLYLSANRMVNNARDVMDTARMAVGRISGSVEKLSGQLDTITGRINRGEGSVGKFLTKDDIYNDAKKATDNLVASSYTLNDALAKLALGSGRFAEVMEAMKHNFLVKGYFEDRGYWDAPEFEMTIDKKIDSLNKLRQEIENQHALNDRSSTQTPH
jgi:phospholipid/cholesterol/gamma-HCH transport system substrate-binding protein